MLPDTVRFLTLPVHLPPVVGKDYHWWTQECYAAASGLLETAGAVVRAKLCPVHFCQKAMVTVPNGCRVHLDQLLLSQQIKPDTSAWWAPSSGLCGLQAPYMPQLHVSVCPQRPSIRVVIVMWLMTYSRAGRL